MIRNFVQGFLGMLVVGTLLIAVYFAVRVPVVPRPQPEPEPAPAKAKVCCCEECQCCCCCAGKEAK